MRFYKAPVYYIIYVLGVLKGRGNKANAVRILASDGSDIEAAVELAVEAQMWPEVIAMTTINNREDLVETHLKSALIEGKYILCNRL